MDDRFKCLDVERVIKNKRGRQWVDVPKDLPESDSESDADDITNFSDDENDDDSDQNSNDLDFINLTESANTTEISTKRLAVLHFDFEEFTLEYLSFLIKSAMPKDGTLKSITKYPTEEYMQRIEDDIKFGPKEFRIQEYDGKDNESDLDNSCDSEELNNANRHYAISRLKFFIVVFEFNSVETSDIIYNGLDNTNLGDSGLKLDLRYVPDDKAFEIPDEYMHLVQSLKPNSTKFKTTNFKPSCFGQSKYKKTWDETPLIKQSFCEKAFAVSDGELSDMEDFCGGATESEFSASEAETEFYTTVDGPVIPKLRKRRIPTDELRAIYGLPAMKQGESSDEEYEEEEEKVEEIVSEAEGSENDYVVDESMKYDGDDSESSDDGKSKDKKDLSAMKKKKIKIREKSKLMIKENAIKREKKKAIVQEYLKECAITEDRFDEFLTDSNVLKVTQTDKRYETTKVALEMIAIRADKLNIIPSFSLGDEELDNSSGPSKKKRKYGK